MIVCIPMDCIIIILLEILFCLIDEFTVSKPRLDTTIGVDIVKSQHM